jgi:hypothetical protein
MLVEKVCHCSPFALSLFAGGSAIGLSATAA